MRTIAPRSGQKVEMPPRVPGRFASPSREGSARPRKTSSFSSISKWTERDGIPFLLVPEATNVDEATRARLAAAGGDDFYISDASPLGVAFNNLRGSSSEDLIRRRVREGRPGSPCAKKYLVSNTEFTSEPICTASRQYQSLKIKQLQSMDLPAEEVDFRIQKVMEKSCLCEDLASSPFAGSATDDPRHSPAVAVCPGPNLAFFSALPRWRRWWDTSTGGFN